MYLIIHIHYITLINYQDTPNICYYIGMENTKKKLNVSGYRGIWGKTLTDGIVTRYAKAFALFTKEDTGKDNPSILIGRDGRESGSHIRDIIIEELNKQGVNTIDGDILPTPTVLFSVREDKYDGAIIITASHNPIEYNGLKFINKEALFTIKEEVSKIEEYYNKEIPSQENTKGNNISSIGETLIKKHADKIVENINVEAIRAKKWKVAVDMINASASVIDPYLFEQLGVELVPLNNIPNGNFAHRPEPLKENLADIGKLVLESGADLGFVHDPDADRLVIVNEKGEVILEEYSIVIAIDNILSKNPGRNIVLNLSTSQMGTDIAHKYGSECFRTKIGEGYVVEGMMEHNAIIGGEGNGGIIYPTISTVRDSFTGIALVLELLAEKNQTVSNYISTLPKYFMKKDKQPVGKNLSEIYDKLKSKWGEAEIDEQDGIRLDFPDQSWVHLRPSNTEPIIRLFGEAKTEERIEELFEEAKELL